MPSPPLYCAVVKARVHVWVRQGPCCFAHQPATTHLYTFRSKFVQGEKIGLCFRRAVPTRMATILCHAAGAGFHPGLKPLPQPPEAVVSFDLFCWAKREMPLHILNAGADGILVCTGRATKKRLLEIIIIRPEKYAKAPSGSAPYLHRKISSKR